MEWAEAKKELQEERDRVRTLAFDKQKVVENSMRQVEEMRKELADAWRAVASAESRAAVAEVLILPNNFFPLLFIYLWYGYLMILIWMILGSMFGS